MVLCPSSEIGGDLMYSFHEFRIEGRYHIFLCDEKGHVHGVHYKGYARKGMAEKVAKTLVDNGYCKTYQIYDTELKITY